MSDFIILKAPDNTLSTEAKQDDIITAINSISGDTTYVTNEILEDGTDTYFCKESSDSDWYIFKIDTDSVFTHATVTNNPTITSYSLARTNYASLIYSTYGNV